MLIVDLINLWSRLVNHTTNPQWQIYIYICMLKCLFNVIKYSVTHILSYSYCLCYNWFSYMKMVGWYGSGLLTQLWFCRLAFRFWPIEGKLTSSMIVVNLGLKMFYYVNKYVSLVQLKKLFIELPGSKKGLRVLKSSLHQGNLFTKCKRCMPKKINK